MDQTDIEKKVEQLETDFVNHKHRDYDKTPKLDVIYSVSKGGSGIKLTGDVTITAGANIAITQSGQDLTIADTVTAKAVDYQAFTTTGSNLWTKPSGVTSNSYVYIQMWGGGGGGAGSSNASGNTAGGGGAEYAELSILASLLNSTVTLTVGAGGTAGAAGANAGGNGASSLFPSTLPLCTARGGNGGGVATIFTAGAGGGYFPGAATTGSGNPALSENSGGSGGGPGSGPGGGSAFKGGGGGAGGSPGGLAGGVSQFGGSGADSSSGNGAGVQGNAPGGGASGSTNNGGGGNKAGAAGGRGEVRIWTIF